MPYFLLYLFLDKIGDIGLLFPLLDNLLIVECLINALGRVSVAIDSVQDVNKKPDEAFHVIFISDNKVYVSVLQLKSDALPRIERVVAIIFQVSGVHW